MKASMVCGIRLALFLTASASSRLARLFTSSSTSPLYAFITRCLFLFPIAVAKQTLGRSFVQLNVSPPLFTNRCFTSAKGYICRSSLQGAA